MAEVYAGGCRASSSNKIEKDLKIPQIMVCSNSQYCNVVQIHYALKVEAAVPGCHGNIEFVIPITIGSVPLNFDPMPTFHPMTHTTLPFNDPYATALPSAPVPIPISEMRKS